MLYVIATKTSGDVFTAQGPFEEEATEEISAAIEFIEETFDLANPHVDRGDNAIHVVRVVHSVDYKKAPPDDR